MGALAGTPRRCVLSGPDQAPGVLSGPDQASVPPALAGLPSEISVYEVSPRDGLQNEPALVPLESKLRLIDALVAAGLRRIEITSFVSPRWIPQLADAEQLARRAKPPEGVTFSALCPNERGLERARATGLPEIAVFVSASETHNRKNVNRSIDETFALFETTVRSALAAGMRVRGYVSTVWGCPFEGNVDVRRVVGIARRLVDIGCAQISLGDTIGVGVPTETRNVLAAVSSEIGMERIALHMHDTRGTALANVMVGLEMGVREIDASIGGLGGCPYAPGAAGNLATEDLVYLLERMGVRTGVNLDALVRAGEIAEQVVLRPLPGRVHQARRRH